MNIALIILAVGLIGTAVFLFCSSESGSKPQSGAAPKDGPSRGIKIVATVVMVASALALTFSGSSVEKDSDTALLFHWIFAQILAVGSIFLCFFIFKLKNWARIGLIVFVAVNLLIRVPMVFQAGQIAFAKPESLEEAYVYGRAEHYVQFLEQMKAVKTREADKERLQLAITNVRMNPHAWVQSNAKGLVRNSIPLFLWFGFVIAFFMRRDVQEQFQ